MTRSYSEVAQSAQSPAQPASPAARRPQGQTTREQLTQLTEKLANAASMALAPTQAPAKTTFIADQKEVKSSIRQTEATLAATPEDDTEIRDILTARLAALKSTLEDARPVGARLDQARAAAARARARREDANAAAEAARALQIATEAEVLTAEQAVAELERQLALQSTAAATSAPPLETATCASSMDQVQMLLAGLIKNLSDDPFVPAEQVQHATLHVSELLKGFHIVAQEAHNMKHAAEAAARGAPPHRIEGKQPQTAPPTVGESVRHVGKQAPKRLITDHFKSVKKVAKSEPYPCRARDLSLASSE